MSDNLNELESLLAKYTNPAQGGDPASTPPPNVSYPVILNGNTVTVSSQEEALRLQAQEQQRLATLAVQARQYAEQLEQEKATQAPQSVTEAPKSLFDPQAFVTEFVTNPQEALRKTMLEMPEFKKKDEELSFVKGELAKKTFAEQHPLYGTNPQIMGGLDKMRTQLGLPQTADGYELAALKAQQMGLLMNENVLREQQRQAFMNLMAAQNQNQQQVNSPQADNQNPYGQFQNQQIAPQPQMYQAPQGVHPSNPQMAAGFMSFNPPPPPPASGRNAYQGGSNTVDQAIQLAANGKLRGEQLREYLAAAERQGIGN